VFEAATRASMTMRHGAKFHEQPEYVEKEEKSRCCIIC